MLGQHVRQDDGLVCASLGHHDNGPDLVHVCVVWRMHAVDVPGNLASREGSDGYERTNVYKPIAKEELMGDEHSLADAGLDEK